MVKVAGIIKIDALISLVAFFVLLWHICATDYCFISQSFAFAFYSILSWQLVSLLVLHIITSLACVRVRSKNAEEAKLRHDLRRIIQLVTGITIGVFGIAHGLQFIFITDCFNTGVGYSYAFYLSVLVVNLLLFVSIFFHCSCSAELAFARWEFLRKSRSSRRTVAKVVLIALAVLLAFSFYLIAADLAFFVV